MAQKEILIKVVMTNNLKQTKYSFAKLPAKILALHKIANIATL